MNRGRILILSAPSGAGKTSLARALLDSRAQTTLSVSHTTRAMRPGERDGVDYWFVTPAEFERMAQAGEFVEHARVFDNRYGTSFAAIERPMHEGRTVVLDIDWQGARAVRARFADAQAVFILPPSREELERRLRGRGQDPEAVIARRMREAEAQIGHYDEYDYVIVNDDFAAALADLEAIVDGRAAERRALPEGLPQRLLETVSLTGVTEHGTHYG
jgi:guanylate kinase